MTIYGLKPRFQALLRPLAGALYRAGATANQVTLLACIVSVALGALLLIALVITILGFFGGLVMSAIKRDRGVKDWGTLIEGHGGVLDLPRLGVLLGADLLPRRPLLVDAVESGRNIRTPCSADVG